MIHTAFRGRYRPSPEDLKPGMRVRVKSLDWFNENASEDEYEDLAVHFDSSPVIFNSNMTSLCGNTYTIKEDNFMENYRKSFRFVEDPSFWITADMIEAIICD